MSKLINLMMVEGDIGYRSALICALKQAAHIGHIADFSTAEAALSELQRAPPHQSPDLLLLDLNLSGMCGFDSMSWFQKYVPKIRIIVLTQSTAERDILNAIACGASGYLLKTATFSQIIEAVQSVQSGGASIDPKIAKYILQRLYQHTLHKLTANRALSERELQILALLAEGKSRKEISGLLVISLNTVAYHVDHIFEKLNVANTPAAIAQGFRSGILWSASGVWAGAVAPRLADA